jgi:putative ATP-binding cassette transporter
LEQVLFLTERAYLPPGTLRELFIRPWAEEGPPDDRNPEDNEFPEISILEALRTLEIEALLKRFGGFDTQQTWESALTLTEQQLLAAARLLVAHPRFAFMDKPSSTLSPEQIRWVLGLLKERSISYVIFEETAATLECCDLLLELEKTGYWTCSPVEDGQPVRKSFEVAV